MQIKITTKQQKKQTKLKIILKRNQTRVIAKLAKFTYVQLEFKPKIEIQNQIV